MSQSSLKGNYASNDSKVKCHWAVRLAAASLFGDAYPSQNLSFEMI